MTYQIQHIRFAFSWYVDLNFNFVLFGHFEPSLASQSCILGYIVVDGGTDFYITPIFLKTYQTIAHSGQHQGLAMRAQPCG